MAKNMIITLEEAFSRQFAKLSKDKKYGSLRNVLTLEKQFRQFRSPGEIVLKDIYWIAEYIIYLTISGNSSSTQKKKLKLLKQVISNSRMKFDFQNYWTIDVLPEKRYLEQDELKKLEDAILPNNLTIVRDFFLMQIYLRGLSVGHVLEIKCSDFIEGRYNYFRANSKEKRSIKVIEKAILILKRYQNSSEYLFPFIKYAYDKDLSEYQNHLIMSQAKQSSTAIINKALKKIAVNVVVNKSLSSKYARHTYAKLVYDKIENPLTTMALLDHLTLESHLDYMEAISRTERHDIVHDHIFGILNKELSNKDNFMYDWIAYKLERSRKW